ncbi:hypothetical protein T492DRAFT_876111 [Pavlovales sp. CCMP2436]|nr:hypothetical protein T492DRAFT_876111 [Pavlovales sp. CCMP2436]
MVRRDDDGGDDDGAHPPRGRFSVQLPAGASQRASSCSAASLAGDNEPQQLPPQLPGDSNGSPPPPPLQTGESDGSRAVADYERIAAATAEQLQPQHQPSGSSKPQVRSRGSQLADVLVTRARTAGWAIARPSAKLQQQQQQEAQLDPSQAAAVSRIQQRSRDRATEQALERDLLAVSSLARDVHKRSEIHKVFLNDENLASIPFITIANAIDAAACEQPIITRRF